MGALCVAALALLACVAAVALWRPTVDIPARWLSKGLYPAPEWLPALLRKLPRPRLNSEQRGALQRDGVVVLRGVLQDPDVLDALNRAWGSREATAPNWLTNGVLRSLVRDGPLGGLAASALNETAVRIYATGVFANAGGHPGGFIPGGPPDGGVHMDLDSTVGYVLPLLTVWIALTDAEHPLEFIRGSHRTNLEHDCPYGPGLNLSDSCVVKLLAEAGGEPLWWDVQAGDVIVFYSQTYHWTVVQEKPRTSLALRFVGADHRMDFMDYYFATVLPCMRRPRWCAPVGSSTLFPVVHPPESSTMDEVPWPVWERRVDALCGLLPLPDQRSFGAKLCPR